MASRPNLIPSSIICKVHDHASLRSLPVWFCRVSFPLPNWATHHVLPIRVVIGWISAASWRSSFPQRVSKTCRHSSISTTCHLSYHLSHLPTLYHHATGRTKRVGNSHLYSSHPLTPGSSIVRLSLVRRFPTRKPQHSAHTRLNMA